MRYLFNTDNEVLDASLSMTNVVPSNAIERMDEDAKVGGGSVVVSGPFTGSDDATVEIEVTDTDTAIDGVPAISAAQFVGVGNGSMDDIAADSGMSAEVFTVTLENLGIVSRKSEAPFQSVVLRAKATGESGNDIVVKVTSALTFTDTDWTLRDSLALGATELTGDEWNFGAALLSSDGTIPLTAPRLRLGDDPQVYRQYRAYDFSAQRFKYDFSPRPVRAISAGARVRSVSGAYTVTVTQGATVETYSNLVTLYDALNAIRTGSALVEVVGAVVDDRQPMGMNATDLSVRTASYCASIVRDGSEAVRYADIGLVVAEDAPTEGLTIECTEGVNFAVRGDNSGRLRDAIAGLLYSDGPYEFRIPLPPTVAGATGPQMHIEFLPVAREGGAPTPGLCAHEFRLGPAAKNGTYRFVYQERPEAPCSCDGYEMDNPPSDDCVGAESETGGIALTDAAYARRVERGTNWIRRFTMANTPLWSARGRDIDYVVKAWGYLSKALKVLVTKGRPEWDEWEASHVYDVDEVIQSGSYRYAATVGGSSDASAPTFPATVGSTVTDGGVAWENVGYLPMGAWDEAFAQLQGDASYLLSDTGPASSAVAWSSLATVNRGTIYIPTTPNGRSYVAENAGTFDSTEESSYPTTTGATFTNGNVVLRDRGAYWTASSAVAKGARTVIPGRGAYEATTGGTTGASQPEWTSEVDRQVTDNTVVWTLRSDRDDFVAPNRNTEVGIEHYRRWESIANDVLATAEIEGNFSGPGGGDRCWVDYPDEPGAFYFDGQERPPYMPVFVKHWYVASKETTDEDGNLVINSTHEFAFAPALSCPESVTVGDAFELTITGVNGTNSGYQSGDSFIASITYASPLALAGGQTGDDTLTWSVFGSESDRLDDYALVTTAPTAYSDGGISFQITQGGIPFALRDQFQFSLEGGHFRWRVNGGSWHEDVEISPTVSLESGLAAAFGGGSPPSWVAGDTWEFNARALNGISKARSPTDYRARWNTSTQIDIVPVSGAATLLLIGEHTIPSTATITLQGSNDSFSTTPLNVSVPWRAGSIRYDIPAPRARYRLLVNAPGSIQWLWLGAPLQLAMQNYRIDVGELTKRYRLPGASRRAAMGVKVDHSAISQASIDAFVAGLSAACESDARRFGIVTADDVPAVVRYSEETLEVSDVRNFQPADADDQLLSMSLQLEPVP